MHDLALLVDAVRLAGRVATSYVPHTTPRWDKSDGTGPVTEADLAVNAVLEQVLRKARPTYGWLSEETEDGAERLSRDTVFIIDPIDGTRSFIDGSSTWAHSVAIAHKGHVTAGVIYLPLRGKLYSAARGRGAWLNGDPITPSLQSTILDADILAAKPTVDPRHWAGGVPQFNREHRPSLAYRMGLVAQGSFDAMLTFRQSWEWDIAAGALIITEAGGTCSDKTGAPLVFNNAHPALNGVVASGPHMHNALITALNPGASTRT